MTIIAIEEHWTSPELTAALKALPADQLDPSLALNELGDSLERLEDLGERRLATMDAQGVDVQILSVAPPATGPLAAADARELSRELNDIAQDAVGRHPDRFRAFATLPMADPAAVAGELRRTAELGFVGAMVYGRTGETKLDDPAYDELFTAAAELRMPLFLHPQVPSASMRNAAYSGFDDLTELALSTFAWGWHLEAATAALRLIARGTFDRHPEVQLVLGHWGELLPFWGSRTAGLSRIAGLERPVGEVMRENVHLTSSGMFEPDLLRHALAVTSIDRLLFSTDYPFQKPSGDEVSAFLDEFESDADREKFTSGNAARLFGLE